MASAPLPAWGFGGVIKAECGGRHRLKRSSKPIIKGHGVGSRRLREHPEVSGTTQHHGRFVDLRGAEIQEYAYVEEIRARQIPS
jgi:hypothetical protein